MLIKLFKYEWKFFWKVPATINLALVIITLLGITSLISPLWTLDYDIIGALMATSLLFYYLSIFAGSIAVSVYIAIRFYKNVYTDEGYLTNTLPVTPRQIILSKLFVGVLWTAITGLVIMFSVLILVAVGLYSYGDNSIIEIIRELMLAWNDMAEIFREIGFRPFSFTFLCVIYSIISTFFSILMLYSAISLGQMFSRHKVAGAIIWYFVEYMVVQFGSSILMTIIGFSVVNRLDYYDSISSIFDPIMIGSIFLYLLGGFGLYCITEYMLKKKLNLD